MALRPTSSRPRASSRTASSSLPEPVLPSTLSGQTTSRLPKRSAGPATTVATATGDSVRTASATAWSWANVSGLTFSTKMSSIPPQVRPTAKASSSETP